MLDGTQICWGEVTPGKANDSIAVGGVSFGQPFYTTPIAVCSIESNGDNGAYEITYSVKCYAVGNTGMTVSEQSQGQFNTYNPLKVNWIAIGRWR